MSAVFGDRRRRSSPSPRSIAYLAVVAAIAENFAVAAERQERTALGYHLDPSSLSRLASSSVTKCCRPGQLLEQRDGQPCVPDTRRSPDSLWPGWNSTGIPVGLPCNLSNYTPASSLARIDEFFANGSLTAGYVHLAPGEFCVDAHTTDGRYVLVVCRTGRYLRVDQSVCFMLVFWTSLLLMLVTLIIHLAMPELRRRVHDKCFVCYLALLGCSALILNSYYYFLRTEPSSNVGLLLMYGFTYTTISSFFWLNVMCIHLWRTVTNMHPIPGRSFYVYALYASIMPLILMGIGKQFFGLTMIQNNFMYVIFEGHLNLDPTIQFNVNILAVLQIINLLAFVRVAYIIWYLKQSPESDTESQNRNAAQILKFSQLSRLFVIMGIYWINIFLMSYIEETIPIFRIIYKYFNLCPGYLIFIKFVLRSKQVMSALEKRYYYNYHQ